MIDCKIYEVDMKREFKVGDEVFIGALSTGITVFGWISSIDKGESLDHTIFIRSESLGPTSVPVRYYQILSIADYGKMGKKLPKCNIHPNDSKHTVEMLIKGLEYRHHLIKSDTVGNT